MRFDPLPLALVGAVGLATALPARGFAAAALPLVVTAAVAIILFLHGLRLSPAAVRAGAGHWRLHLVVLAVTFLVFPALVLLARAALPAAFPAALWTGFLFLAVAPSTVQSSIGFTAVAGGNVPAALCAATLSNAAGVVLTPLLATLILDLGPGGLTPAKALAVVAQIVLPALLGQLARPWGGGWADRNAGLLKLADRAAILVIVYAAFSAAVVAGLWTRVPPATLAIVAAGDLALVAAALALTALAARASAFSPADGLAMRFVGSTKSLATGAPIAGALFPAASVGVTILPLMLYHPLQSLICATLAARSGRRTPEPA